MRRHILPRLLITLIGLGLALWGISNVMLGFAGESAAAVVTDISRQGRAFH